MKPNKILLFPLALLLNYFCYAQEKTITGIVKEKTELLPGASVYIKNKHKGVAADIDGKFSIKVMVGDTLVFSYVGFEQYELAIEKEQTTYFIIQLKQRPDFGITDYGIPMPPKRKNNDNLAITKISKAQLRKAKRQQTISSNADTNFIGKTFIAQTGISCAKSINGGCTIYSYCKLKFNKNFVEVSFPNKIFCSPDSMNKGYQQNATFSKKYKWYALNNWFIIKGFEEYKKYAFKEENEKNNIQEIKTSPQKLDTSITNKYKKKLEDLNANNITIEPTSTKTKKAIFYKYYNGYKLDEYDDKEFIFKETTLKLDGNIDIVEHVEVYFDTYESYYSSCNIKSKSISSWLGFTIGTAYKYDTKENIIESINSDEGYTFTYKDVFHFLEEKSITIKKPTITKVYKITNNNIKTWVISYEDIKIGKIVTYILNATDGKIINRLEENLPVFIEGVK
jgi:CarboxypepD_reg-like domain